MAILRPKVGLKLGKSIDISLAYFRSNFCGFKILLREMALNGGLFRQKTNINAFRLNVRKH